MKKKFSLWINLAVICLCVCSIAIGVYAATSATLTVSGQIGFQAHDCEVEVSMTQMGYALGDGTTYQTTPVAVDMDSNTAGAQATGKVAGNGGAGTISNVALDALNFTDLAGNEIPNIILTLTVTNKSAYKVAATVVLDDLDNLAYSREYNYGTTAQNEKTAHSGAVILNDKNAAENKSATFTITLKVDDPDENITSVASTLKITANFAKYDQNALIFEDTITTVGIRYTLNSSKDAYSVAGNMGMDDNGNPFPIPKNTKISAFINGLPVTEISAWGLSIPDIQTVSIPNTVINIGEYALSGLGPITELIIPNSVTNIGDSALAQNSSLTTVKLSNALTVLASNIFRSTGLTSIEIPNSVTEIGRCAFSGCDKLITITGLESVEIIGEEAFSFCSKLNNVVFSEKLETIQSSAFQNCASLTSFVIPNGAVLEGYYNFSGCTQLQSIIIPNSVTQIVNCCFSDCVSLTSVIIPESVSFIGEFAFKSCPIKEITIPKSVTYIDAAFSSCDQLTTVYFEGITPATFSNNSIFAGCSKLEKIYVPDGAVEAYKGVANLSSYVDKIDSIANKPAA